MTKLSEVAIEESMTGTRTGMLLPFSFEEGLSHTFYPLLPDNFTQNQNIIDWYITVNRKSFYDCVHHVKNQRMHLHYMEKPL
jgi:hypothetical protein